MDKLAIVLLDMEPPGLDIQTVFAPNRHLAAKTLVFIDFLAGRFEAPSLGSTSEVDRGCGKLSP